MSRRGRACTLSVCDPRGENLPVVSLVGVSFIKAEISLVMRSSESDVAYTESCCEGSIPAGVNCVFGYFPLFLESERFGVIPEIGWILCELGEGAEKPVGEHEIALEERVGAAGLRGESVSNKKRSTKMVGMRRKK